VKRLKVIDLFAGPGGLGEGFSAFTHSKNHPFEIAISIEKEESAHRTLMLRSFFRQFGDSPPDEYYQFLRGELGNTPEEHLYKMPQFSKEVIAAQTEARRLTLGVDNIEINSAITNAIGDDECILIGGPPCQAYSLVGRARNQGIQSYKAEEDSRNFLYLEYLNIIARYQPVLFVMENVKGMLSAKINGHPIFDSISRDLQNPSEATGCAPQARRKKHKYRIVSLVCPPSSETAKNDGTSESKSYIIRTENYGIPQRRHRVILLGLREDIADKWNNDLCLIPNNHQTTTAEVIDDLPKLRSGLSKGGNSNEQWLNTIKKAQETLISTLENSSLSLIGRQLEKIKMQLSVPKYIQGANQGLKKDTSLELASNTELQDWYTDKRLGNYITNHQTRGHIEQDLHRYLFCSTWAKVALQNNWEDLFPKSRDYPTPLKPNHKNFDSGKFADRFRVQVSHTPATTITSHISKDGHYFIHYDPLQCRSFTVREAARIQTFPDNYFFVGTRTQQYVQVGNAVPPFLAFKIAAICHGIINN